MLREMPNNAFSENFAFTFQAKSHEILGLAPRLRSGLPFGTASQDSQAFDMHVIDTFWMTREIAGVALVDMQAWKWLYEHPRASPADLRKAVVNIAKDVWNEYFAPILGVKDGLDSSILAIYSHMIDPVPSTTRIPPPTTIILSKARDGSSRYPELSPIFL